MNNLERHMLRDPALVLDAQRKREAERKRQAPWREAIRKQQNPEPIRDRYSEMAERLLNRIKGKS